MGVLLGTGAGRPVSMTRGRTGTAASVSTGPCAFELGVEVAPGGSWKSRAAWAASEAGVSSARSGRAKAWRVIVSGTWGVERAA